MNVFASLQAAGNRLRGGSSYLKTPWYRLTFREFGKRSRIRRPLLITNPQYIRIGSRVHIRDGARLEAVADDSGREPELTIGDGTSMEQGCHLACHCRVTIGRYVTLAPYVVIAEATHPRAPEGFSLVDGIDPAESFIEIGEGVFLGTGCVILPNVTIGRYAVVGANSVVRSDIPDYAVAVGTPARVVGTTLEALPRSAVAEGESLVGARPHAGLPFSRNGG